MRAEGQANDSDAPEVDAVGVVVPAVSASTVQVLDVVVAFVDDVIVRDLLWK